METERSDVWLDGVQRTSKNRAQIKVGIPSGIRFNMSVEVATQTE